MKYSFFSQFDSLASKISPDHLERTSPLALTLFQISALTKLKRKRKCTCNRHIVFRYRWSQQSLPVNQSDFVHSIWNDFIKLSGCHFTHGKKKKKKKLILAPGEKKTPRFSKYSTPTTCDSQTNSTISWETTLSYLFTRMPSKRNLEHLAKKWKSVIDEIN